jgi:hypothetical protein
MHDVEYKKFSLGIGCSGRVFDVVEKGYKNDDDGFGFMWNFRSRSPYSPPPMPAPTYFRHGMPMYPSYSRRYDPYMEGYFPPMERSNGHEYRYRDRGTRLTPPSASARYNRR